MFEVELEFFIRNQDRLVSQHDGKILVLRGENVVSSHENMLDAYLSASAAFELGTFMLQTCRPGPEAYTVTLASTWGARA